MSTALLASLRMDSCPLPPHRRSHYVTRLAELLKGSDANSQQQLPRQPPRSIGGRRAQQQQQQQAPPNPTGLAPSVAHTFDELVLLAGAAEKETAAYGENSQAARMLAHITAGGGGSNNSGGAASFRGVGNNGDGERPATRGPRIEEASAEGGEIAAAAATPAQLLAAVEAARAAFVSSVSLESDVQRYLPLTLRLPAGAMPPAPPSATAGIGATGYGAPHTASDVTKTAEAAVAEARQRIASDRSAARTVVASSGLFTAAVAAGATAADQLVGSGGSAAIPRFRVPAAQQNLLPPFIVGGDAAQFLSSQQMADGRGYEAAVASLGGARAAPFTAAGLLVFPPPEGSATVIDSASSASFCGLDTSAVQPLSTAAARRSALEAAAADAAERGTAAPAAVAELRAQAAALGVQRTWMPTVTDWLAAKDMAHIPMLRFK